MMIYMNRSFNFALEETVDRVDRLSTMFWIGVTVGVVATTVFVSLLPDLEYHLRMFSIEQLTVTDYDDDSDKDKEKDNGIDYCNNSGKDNYSLTLFANTYYGINNSEVGLTIKNIYYFIYQCVSYTLQNYYHSSLNNTINNHSNRNSYRTSCRNSYSSNQSIRIKSLVDSNIIETNDYTELTMVVLPHHIDRNGHMNNSNYFYQLNFSRRHFMIKMKLFQLLQQLNLNIIVQSQTIRYRKELKLFQPYTIRTRIISWNDRDKSFYLESKFIITKNNSNSNCNSFSDSCRNYVNNSVKSCYELVNKYVNTTKIENYVNNCVNKIKNSSYINSIISRYVEKYGSTDEDDSNNNDNSGTIRTRFDSYADTEVNGNTEAISGSNRNSLALRTIEDDRNSYNNRKEFVAAIHYCKYRMVPRKKSKIKNSNSPLKNLNPLILNTDCFSNKSTFDAINSQKLNATDVLKLAKLIPQDYVHYDNEIKVGHTCKDIYGYYLYLYDMNNDNTNTNNTSSCNSANLNHNSNNSILNDSLDISNIDHLEANSTVNEEIDGRNSCKSTPRGFIQYWEIANAMSSKELNPRQ